MPEARLQRTREINQPHLRGATWTYCPICKTEHWTQYRIVSDDFIGSCGHTITLDQLRAGRPKPQFSIASSFLLSEQPEADMNVYDTAETPRGV